MKIKQEILKKRNLKSSNLNFVNPPIKDDKNKIIMFWTPKAACSFVLNIFFNHMFDQNFNEYTNVHKIRQDYYQIIKNQIKFNDLVDGKYLKIKIVRNPYHRIVSSYIFSIFYSKNSQNSSFFDFLMKFINNKIDDKFIYYHTEPQYNNYDKYIDKIIKIEEIGIELQEIDKQKNTKLYDSYLTMNNILESKGEIKKNNDENFCGYKIFQLNDILTNFVPPYVNFYNDEIKLLVEKIFIKDIKKYKYKFPY